MKISTAIDERVWKEFKDLSEEVHQSLSGLLTEAIREYVRRRRIRPMFLKHAEESLEENAALGRLLAK